MREVFVGECGFSGMSFPDLFEESSHYFGLELEGEIAAAFRVVKPNNNNELPITRDCPSSHLFDDINYFQFSRVVVAHKFRGRNLFRQCVDLAVRYGSSHGADALLSDVVQVSQLAYTSCGFQTIGTGFCDQSIDIHGDRRHNAIAMRKLIRS